MNKKPKSGQVTLNKNYEPKPWLVGFRMELRFRNGKKALIELPKDAEITKAYCTRQLGIVEVDGGDGYVRAEHDGTGTLALNVAWKKRPASPKRGRSPPRASPR